jgi:hypothetical protein
MLAAGRLAGLSALGAHYADPDALAISPCGKGLVSGQNSDRNRWTTSRSQGIEMTTVEPPER